MFESLQLVGISKDSSRAIRLNWYFHPFPLVSIEILDTDFVRLATSCDINRRPLILQDLQPPLLCRYLRVCFNWRPFLKLKPNILMEWLVFLLWQLTITGRQGLSASSCRTQVGFFYGYSHVLPNDLVPVHLPDSVSTLNIAEIKVSLNDQQDSSEEGFLLRTVVIFGLVCSTGEYFDVRGVGRPQPVPLQLVLGPPS